jgi:hypothetical protein
MAWGTVTVGGIAFREEVDALDDGATVRIRGQESHPPQLLAAVEGAHHNIASMRVLASADDLLVPVVFTDKGALTGFYRIKEARSELVRYFNGGYQKADWQLTLERVGTSRDVEAESWLPLIARPDDIVGTQTAVFWHAPAIGATSYFTGATSPSGQIDRPGEDGIVRVYTGLPTDHPRWTVRADDYLRGGARISFDTIRRIGLLTPSVAVWEMTNSLVKVAPGTAGRIVVSCFENSIYRSPATFEFTVAGVALGVQPELTILRNDPEEVVVSLTYPTAPGRVIVDLSLRRGARFVTGAIRRNASASLGVTEVGTAATTAVTGGVRQTTADADGNRFVLGSSRNATLNAAAGGITFTGTRLDFFAGHEVDPGQAGDLYADLLSQYLGSAGERVRVVRR